jgi:hypothetical protein
VRFEVFTAVEMGIVIFWFMMPQDVGHYQQFGGTYHLHLQDEDISNDLQDYMAS